MKKLSALVALVFFASNAYAFGGNYGSPRQETKTSLYHRLPKGCTFYADYESGEIYGKKYLTKGSRTSTFTASRGASNPATYIDENGVIQVTTTSNQPRLTKGFYDTTGFVSRPGVLIEAAGTNYAIDSLFSIDVGANGVSDYWFNGYGTMSLVDPSDLSNVASHKWQRCQHTFNGVNGSINGFLMQSTGVGTFAQNDYVTVSFYIKGSSTIDAGSILKVRILGVNAAGGALAPVNDNLTVLKNVNYENPIRVTMSLLLTHADTSQVKVIIGSNEGVQPLNGNSLDFSITSVQVEKNTYATSWIPTAASALTRNAEKLTYGTSGNRTAASESLFVKFTPLGAFANDGIYRKITTTTNNDGVLYKVNTGTVLTYGAESGTGFNGSTSILDGVSYVACGVNVSTTGNPNALLYLNGTLDGTQNSDHSMPDFGASMYVGSGSASTQQANSIISKVAIFNRALSAAEVKAVSDEL